MTNSRRVRSPYPAASTGGTSYMGTNDNRTSVRYASEAAQPPKLFAFSPPHPVARLPPRS